MREAAAPVFAAAAPFSPSIAAISRFSVSISPLIFVLRWFAGSQTRFLCENDCDVSRTEKMAYKRLLCVLAAPAFAAAPVFAAAAPFFA